MFLFYTQLRKVCGKSEDILTVHLLILALLILLNAFFALSEIAVVTVNDKKIKKLSSQGNTEAMSISYEYLRLSPTILPV